MRTLYRFNRAILATVLGISWGLVALLRPERLAVLTYEDGVFEWAGAVAFLGASVVFLVGFFGGRADYPSLLVRTRRNLPLLGFSLLFFVAFGEEISWGQRVRHSNPNGVQRAQPSGRDQHPQPGAFPGPRKDW